MGKGSWQNKFFVFIVILGLFTLFSVRLYEEHTEAEQAEALKKAPDFVLSVYCDVTGEGILLRHKSYWHRSNGRGLIKVEEKALWKRTHVSREGDGLNLYSEEYDRGIRLNQFCPPPNKEEFEE